MGPKYLHVTIAVDGNHCSIDAWQEHWYGDFQHHRQRTFARPAHGAADCLSSLVDLYEEFLQWTPQERGLELTKMSRGTFRNRPPIDGSSHRPTSHVTCP